MKVTRLRVTNYRGIATLDVPLPDAGAVVRGANGRGKTSVLRAIRAALEARDVSPDAIRHGATNAEILVDLDDVTVRRAITPKGSTVRVTTADGMERRKPQTWLSELLGATLDPLDLFLAAPKDRRARILAALPVRVTREQLRQWAPDLPDGPPTETEHGLEVLDRVRAAYYARRTDANAAARGARAEAERLRAAVPTGPASGGPGVAEARRALAGAKANLADAESRRRNADEHARKTAGLRERIERHRATAKAERPGANELDARAAEMADGEHLVRRLEAQLAEARADLESAKRRLQQTQDRHRIADEQERAAADLETMLSATAPSGATDAELNAARGAVAGAEETLQTAEDLTRRDEAFATAERARTIAEDAERVAADLDRAVRALTDDAPKALLASAGAIPGLGLDGDSITLDGTSLDGLCGAEQIRFAVQIAKRAAAGAGLKLLTVDGLERLDPEQLRVFLDEATAGGWQVIATRVDAGEMVVEAIERHDADAPGPQPAVTQ